MSVESTDALPRQTLPQAWEASPTFADVLYEWMGRAPWLAISAIAHLMFFFLLAVIPWSLFDEEDAQIIHVGAPDIAPEIIEEPEIEELPEVVPEETPEEPVLHESERFEPSEIPSNTDFAPELGNLSEQDWVDSSVFEGSNLIGVGSGAGSHGGRFGHGAGTGGGSPSILEIDRGLTWLAEHQDEDGKWDSDEFMKHDPVSDRCAGPGRAEHDVGVTSLALLAFLGRGNTTRQGKYKDNVIRGIKWLRDQQDFENGLIGEKIGTAYLYDHSIATLAMCEAYYFSKSPILRSSAQKAVNFVTTARNPYGVWRYSNPPDGQNDTSVTGWMVFALESARQAGLKVDSQAFPDALTWFDEVSDPGTGRVGYDSIGSLSARVPGLNQDFPADRTEAMTAVGLLCRFFLGQDPQDVPIMNRHADLLLKELPDWTTDGKTNDLYYWYYGTYAMYQMGGKHWRTWNRAMKPAILDTQQDEGAALGSWDPDGPWGMVGGRVYSTAMMVLSLEVYFRYARVLGAR